VLGSGIVALAVDKVDAAAFAGFETVMIERGEESAAGVIVLGDRHVIADVRYRTALQRIRGAGITVEGIDLYDFEKIGITPSMLVLPVRRD
jgi:N-dimethylarginine dimethylaminohydrolase